jgi:hypothetical protein
MFKTVVKEILQFLLNQELERVCRDHNAEQNIVTKQRLGQRAIDIKALSDKLDHTTK